MEVFFSLNNNTFIIIYVIKLQFQPITIYVSQFLDYILNSLNGIYNIQLYNAKTYSEIWRLFANVFPRPP